MYGWCVCGVIFVCAFCITPAFEQRQLHALQRQPQQSSLSSHLAYLNKHERHALPTVNRILYVHIYVQCAIHMQDSAYIVLTTLYICSCHQKRDEYNCILELFAGRFFVCVFVVCGPYCTLCRAGSSLATINAFTPLPHRHHSPNAPWTVPANRSAPWMVAPCCRPAWCRAINCRSASTV